ncbi:MAG: histidine kinase [Bacteroides sp.]|nr:histidine kinase [Bacteroides sp.]
MKRNLFSYRTAAVFAFIISILVHFFFGVLLWFGRTVMLADGVRGLNESSLPQLRWEWFALSQVSVFVFSFLLFQVNFWILKAELKKNRTLSIIIASVIGTVIMTYILLHVQIYIFDIELGDYYWQAVSGNMIRDLFLTVIIIFISQILYLSNKKQQIAIENEKLLAENMKSRYETLKSQVNPHFLFNTLNTLSTMIKIDPDKAQEYVQNMSSVFRYTLQNKEETSLVEELKFTCDYCLLMKIRYGESLGFELNIDKQYENYLIIPLSIQTLVENAIKHNVISKRQPLIVSIYTAENERLIVSNPLQEKKEAEPGEGIGLANLVERYRLHFQTEPEVSCTDGVFMVTLPLIKPQQL